MKPAKKTKVNVLVLFDDNPLGPPRSVEFDPAKLKVSTILTRAAVFHSYTPLVNILHVDETEAAIELPPCENGCAHVITARAVK